MPENQSQARGDPEIAKRVKYLRGDRTQLQFAEALGISRGVLSSVESAYFMPSRKFLLALREVTGCDINWVLTGEGEPITAQKQDRPQEAQSTQVDAEIVAETVTTYPSSGYADTRTIKEMLEVLKGDWKMRGTAFERLLTGERWRWIVERADPSDVDRVRWFCGQSDIGDAADLAAILEYLKVVRDRRMG